MGSKGLGADTYDLWLPETRSIIRFLAPSETIEGVVYGRYRQSGGRPPGRGMLAATARRIIFIDHKPLFVNADEISYQVVSGISHSSTGFIDTVTLSTRVGEITVRTFNPRAANLFVQAIERHIFDQPADFRPLAPEPAGK